MKIEVTPLTIDTKLVEKDRPSVPFVINPKYIWTLPDDIHAWFVENECVYDLVRGKRNAIMLEVSDQVAVAFKLTFGDRLEP